MTVVTAVAPCHVRPGRLLRAARPRGQTVRERTYAGEWIGTTSEGTAIAFDVSDANIVTRITIGRDNRGCRDALTFPSLSLTIGESDLPGRVPISASPGFGFGSGSERAELRASASTVLVHPVGAGHGNVSELREMRKYRGVLDRNEAITMRTHDYLGAMAARDQPVLPPRGRSRRLRRTLGWLTGAQLRLRDILTERAERGLR